MSIIAIVLLGLIQGLTEFLPISSSGHLVFVQQFWQIDAADLWLDTALHLGSSIAVIIFFWKSIKQIISRLVKALLSAKLDLMPKEIWLIAIASIPAAIVGVGANDLIEKLFMSPKILPFTFGLTAFLLYTTKNLQVKTKKDFKTISKMSWLDAIVIGLMQALAILPGISRSGSTFSAGIWRRLKLKTSFYFSFLLSIPAIFGAFLLESNQLTNRSIFNLEFVLSFGSSLIASLLALNIFNYLLKFKKIYYFSYYCIVLAIVSALVFYI